MQQIDPNIMPQMNKNTDKYQQLTKSSTNKGTIAIGSKFTVSTDKMGGGDGQTETTKANERSKPNLNEEESLAHDGLMDDEDFEKLMGNIEKTHPVVPSQATAGKHVSKQPPHNNQVMNNTSGIEDEDFF